MWKFVFLAIASILLVLLLQSCAQPGSLSGGPKDTTPPKLNKEASTKNFQTNFKKQTIELTFDEWLVLEKAFTQVVVSPPLEKPPKVTLRGKTVKFSFQEDEVLKENATYTINFGEAIKDLNEKNVVKDLRFLFSTGDYIDSLQVSGALTDAFTGEPSKDVLLMLYDNLSDSVVRKERPFYFAKTDKSGRFKIENVKSDTFKVLALKDENFNYLFDLETEEIGFLEDYIILSDSTQPNIEMQIFQEQISMRIVKKDSTTYGKLKLIFNQEPFGINLSTEKEVDPIYYQYDKDTIVVWYDDSTGIATDFYITLDTIIDTLQLPLSKRNAFYEKAKLVPAKKGGNGVVKLNPFKPVQTIFNHPLLRFDTSFIQLFPDSLTTPENVVPKIDSLEQTKLTMEYKWKEKSKYKLLLLPGAVTDIFGLSNKDTILSQYNVVEKDQFGDIKLKVENADTSKAYVLQLYFKKNNLVDEFFVEGDSTYQKVFKALPAGSYSLTIIEDLNSNQKWDTGNYDRKTQPERMTIRPLDELRAGWELESTISLEKFKK